MDVVAVHRGKISDASAVHASALVVDGMVNGVFDDTLLDEMREGGYTACIVTLSMPFYNPDRVLQAMRDVSEWLELFERRSDALVPVHRPEDIRTAKASGRIGIIFGMQDGGAFADELALLRAYHTLGLRISSLAYNRRNSLGDGCVEPADGGLSLAGRSAVEHLAEFGIVLDLSHMGHRSAMEALALYPGPAVVSHSNARALCDNLRNVSDELIDAVAAKGGVVGITALPMLLTRKRTKPERTIEDIFDHLDYVVKRVGIDHVSFASDFFLISLPEAIARNVAGPFLARFGRPPITDEADFDPQTYELLYPSGFATARDAPNLTSGLLARGYKPEDVHKFLGGNLLRVFEQVW